MAPCLAEITAPLPMHGLLDDRDGLDMEHLLDPDLVLALGCGSRARGGNSCGGGAARREHLAHGAAAAAAWLAQSCPVLGAY
jgi:hypothetical protein